MKNLLILIVIFAALFLFAATKKTQADFQWGCFGVQGSFSVSSGNWPKGQTMTLSCYSDIDPADGGQPCMYNGQEVTCPCVPKLWNYDYPNTQTVSPGQAFNFQRCSCATGQCLQITDMPKNCTANLSDYPNVACLDNNNSTTVTFTVSCNSPTSTPTPPPTPTPVPPDLSIASNSFVLTDSTGSAKTTFAPGENVYVQLKAQNGGSGTAPTGAITNIYSNSSKAPAAKTASDISGGFQITHGSFPSGSGFWYCSTSTCPNGYTDQFKNTSGTVVNSFPAPSTPGNYTAWAYINYNNTITESDSSNDTNNTASYNYTVAAAPTYSIQGTVFVDQNSDYQFNGPDTAYTANSPTPAISTTLKDGTTVAATISNGVFTLSNLPAGTYMVNYTSSVPAGYSRWPSGFKVTVGPNCQGQPVTPPSGSPFTSGQCDANGNLSGLNFALSLYSSWLQSTGLDMRIDTGFDDVIPSSGTYSSIVGSAGTPGIVFSGSSNANFGQGSASSTNWLVAGSFAKPYAKSGALKTSYDSLLATIKNSGTPLPNLTSLSACNVLTNCVLDSTANGVYKDDTAGDKVTISSGAISGTQKVVLLINGTVTIKGAISVAQGGYLLVVAKNGIIVDPSVGTAPASNPPSQIDGDYVSNQSITIQGNSNCASNQADKMLVIAGSLVINADRASNGSLNNQRNLCADNATYPSLKLLERPDFFLNAPSYIQSPATQWQEVAP